MKPFNERFEEYKLSISGLTSIAEESFMYWFKNFVNKGESFNPNNFITGKIYSFEYLDKLDEKKPFINKRPVVFFTGFSNPQNKDAFSGIDLILMPPVIRVPFFNKLFSVYSSQIESNMKKQDLGEKLDQIQLKTDYQTLDIILKDIPFKNTYRYWDFKKVRDIKEIPYEDWTRIVYLYTRSSEGTRIEEIYNKNLKA